MVVTPWGPSSELRFRQLPPGPATPPAEVRHNQRQRIFGALVALAVEGGFEAVRVEDVVELSGVSRRAFYAHFSDLGECVVAALDALAGPALAQLAAAADGAGESEAPRRSLDAFLELVVDQPAAARFCLVEAYAAGSGAIARIDEIRGLFIEHAHLVLARAPDAEQRPTSLLRAIVGGIERTVYARLYRGSESDLLSLREEIGHWVRSYLPPPGPPRGMRRPALKSVDFRQRQAASTTEQRILRAVAKLVGDEGFASMRIAAIAKCAGVSQRTFYEHFDDKEAALLAALDQGAARMLAETLPAFRRGREWRWAVRSALEAFFAFGVAEPEYTTLGAVGVFGAGRRALTQREGLQRGMEAILPQEAALPVRPELLAELIAGAIYGLTYDQVRRRGPQSLDELLPLATYLVLVPFLGTVEAYEVARGR